MIRFHRGKRPAISGRRCQPCAFRSKLRHRPVGRKFRSRRRVASAKEIADAGQQPGDERARQIRHSKQRHELVSRGGQQLIRRNAA